MSDIFSYVYPLAVAVAFMSCIFLIARSRGRYDLIDVAWGLTFIGIALVSYTAHMPGFFTVQTLVTTLVFMWGMRLSFHIYMRWDRSRTEDKRYSEMRKRFDRLPGGVRWNMFVRVFLLQAVLALVVSLPVVTVNSAEPLLFNVGTLIGLMVWVIGFLFESLGDYQLRRHLSDPKSKGKLMTTGLWKFTRHPNYFGEFAQWWGIFIMAVPAGGWWISLVGPLVISILLLFVSGVPLTEKHFEGRKGWKEYKRRTSIFLPLPPKKV